MLTGRSLVASRALQVFVQAVRKVEKFDHSRIEARLGSVSAASLLQRVGEWDSILTVR